MTRSCLCTQCMRGKSVLGGGWQEKPGYGQAYQSGAGPLENSCTTPLYTQNVDSNLESATDLTSVPRHSTIPISCRVPPRVVILVGDFSSLQKVQLSVHRSQHRMNVFFTKPAIRRNRRSSRRQRPTLFSASPSTPPTHRLPGANLRHQPQGYHPFRRSQFRPHGGCPASSRGLF